MTNAAWAIMTTRMMPKYSVRPAASKAYCPPSSSPRMTLWNSRPPDGIRASPGGLRIDEVGLLGVGRQHDPDLAAHPLLDHVGALRPTRRVPGQRTDHRVHLVL